MQTMIRSAQPADIPFIYQTLLKCLRHDSAIGKSTRSHIFFEEYRKVVDSLLLSSLTLVACSREYPEVIFAYLIYDKPNTIHFAFTKQAFRKLGMQSQLLAEAGLANKTCFVTHRTDSTKWCQSRTEYNPFKLYIRSHDETRSS